MRSEGAHAARKGRTGEYSALPPVCRVRRCGARASPLQTARRMRHGIVGRGCCRSSIPVSRRGRVHFMRTIVRSADLPLCGEGATVERSHGERAQRANRHGGHSPQAGCDRAAGARILPSPVNAGPGRGARRRQQSGKAPRPAWVPPEVGSPGPLAGSGPALQGAGT
jgi:hypothetical protein